MEVEKDKIKDLFSSKLGNFEPEVPASVWGGGLDQLLSDPLTPSADANSANSSTGNAASSSGNASIIKVVAVIIGLAAAIATGILFIPDGKEERIVIDSKNIVTEEPQVPFVERPDTGKIVLPVEPMIVKAEAPVYKQEDIEPVVEEEPVVVAVDTSEVTEEPPKEVIKQVVVVDGPLVLKPTAELPKKKVSHGISLGLKLMPICLQKI